MYRSSSKCVLSWQVYSYSNSRANGQTAWKQLKSCEYTMLLMMAGRGHKCENSFVYGHLMWRRMAPSGTSSAHCHITKPRYAVSSCVSAVGSGFQDESPPCGTAGIVCWETELGLKSGLLHSHHVIFSRKESLLSLSPCL